MASKAASAQQQEANPDKGSAPDEHADPPGSGSTDADVANEVAPKGDALSDTPERNDAADASAPVDPVDSDTGTVKAGSPAEAAIESETADDAGQAAVGMRPVTDGESDSAQVAEPTDRDAGDEPDPSPRLRRIDRLAALATGVLLVAAIAAATTWNSGRADEAETTQAVAAARDAATALTTIKFGTAQADVQDVIDRSTGEFAAMFSQNLDSYVQLVDRSKIDTVGKVIEAGVEGQEPNKVRTLVAVRSTVRNQTVPNGEEREYRMRVEMTKEGGRWLVSRVDFLQ